METVWTKHRHEITYIYNENQLRGIKFDGNKKQCFHVLQCASDTSFCKVEAVLASKQNEKGKERISGRIELSTEIIQEFLA